MTQEGRHRVRSNACSGPKLVCLSAFATAILVLPLFFGKSGNASQDKGKDMRRDMRHSIFMISGLDARTPEEKQALENIYAWIDLKSPGKTMSPNTSLGFKEFTGNPPKYAFTPSDATFISQPTQDEPLPDMTQGKPMILGEEKTLLTKPINEIVPWTPFWIVDMPDIGNSAKPEGIIWRGADGRLIANPPMIDEKIARDSWNKHAPSGVTTLECSQFMGKMPPRVIIRKSCGNSELDLLAADALRKHLLAMQTLTMIDNVSFRPFRSDVLWHLRN